MMEKQKAIQKQWYENKSNRKEGEIVEISHLAHIHRLRNLIPVQKVTLSLNCGCGKGEQQDIFGPSIGIDLSLENIRSLQHRGGRGVVADMEFLPFKDNTFDLVYGFGVLHHLSNIRKGVSEATRVLKKGGYIGFGGENNGWCPFVYIMSLLYRNWKIEKGSYRIREKNLRKIFRESGNQEFKIERHGMAIYGMGKTVFKLTSLIERVLSKIKFLNLFSSHCYFGGRKG